MTEIKASCWPAVAGRPISGLNEAGINWLCEKISNPLEVNGAFRGVLQVFRLRLQKALHFTLGLETAGCESFESLLNERAERFVPHKPISLPLNALIAISDRAGEAVEAAHDASAQVFIGNDQSNDQPITTAGRNICESKDKSGALRLCAPESIAAVCEDLQTVMFDMNDALDGLFPDNSLWRGTL